LWTAQELWRELRLGRKLWWQEFLPPEGAPLIMARRMMERPGD
jgi:hypothetical protein